MNVLGNNNSKRLSTLISNVIEESRNKSKIMLSKEIEIAMDEWKDF